MCKRSVISIVSYSFKQSVLYWRTYLFDKEVHKSMDDACYNKTKQRPE